MFPVCLSAAVSLGCHLVCKAYFLARAIKQASPVEPFPFTAEIVFPDLSTVTSIVTRQA